MTLLNEATNRTDEADLVILAHVEAIRGRNQAATASAVAALIGGAPVVKIATRLARLRDLGALEFEQRRVAPDSYFEKGPAVLLTDFGTKRLPYQLTELGVELLRQELIGWTPSIHEEERRAKKLRLIVDQSKG